MLVDCFLDIIVDMNEMSNFEEAFFAVMNASLDFITIMELMVDGRGRSGDGFIELFFKKIMPVGIDCKSSDSPPFLFNFSFRSSFLFRGGVVFQIFSFFSSLVQFRGLVASDLVLSMAYSSNPPLLSYFCHPRYLSGT